MTTQEPQARLPYVEPSHPRGPIFLILPVKKVRFLHPGYPENSNILLQFSALDADDGIEYNTAQVACAIVANNRWDGFFCVDREGRQRINRKSLAGKTLDRDEYYFHVPVLNSTHGKISKSSALNELLTVRKERSLKTTQLHLPLPNGHFLTITCRLTGPACLERTLTLSPRLCLRIAAA
jgi:hypothetical protein